jgi:hypothetical protein
VKQGGIGSLLAGGFPGLKKTGAAAAAKPETKPTPVEEKKEVITSPVEEKPKSVDKSPISPTTGVAPVPAFTVPVTSSAASSATEKPRNVYMVAAQFRFINMFYYSWKGDCITSL